MATIDRQATTLALAHALSAAERGLAVIPLSRTKLPALRSPHRTDPAAPACHGECGRFGHGVYDASTDSRRIRALFAAAPRATGYGIACGLPPHHLIGVDLDTKSGTDSSAALRELALRHLFTIPETVVVLTPSGGRHLWLTGPPDTVVPNSAGRLAPGIDIRGAGGYLVGPGSRTDHGVYGTVPGTAHLAPAACPPALLRLLLPPPRTPAPPHARTGQGGGQGLVQFVLAAHEGQRNTRLFWAACRAYEHGLTPDLLPALIEAALATGLTEREARATIASAARLTGHHPRIRTIDPAPAPRLWPMPLTHVVLTSGRSIELTELRMSSTYSGTLEGYPCGPVNEMAINGLLRAAQQAYPTTRVHLIPPPREYPDHRAGAFGPVEVLPSVGCVGAFRSTPVDESHDPVLHRSLLTVVWFQPTPSTPSDDKAHPALRNLNWETLAQDHEL